MKYQELLNIKEKKDIIYTDLLNCDEWVLRRDEVKKRDGLECVLCEHGKSDGVAFSGGHKLYIGKEKGDLTLTSEKFHLEVHHKFYIRGRLPWEYGEDELITVCNFCHRKIHETEIINVYNESKTEKYLLDTCDRCGGKKIFQEYSHIEGGICFKCRGVGGIIPVFNI